MEEKRTHIRISQLHLIHYECRDTEQQVTHQGMGRTLDLSATGLQLELAADFELDQKITITLGVGDDLLELEGRVARQEPAHGSKSVYGIELTDYKGEGGDRLTRYIQAIQTAPSDRRRHVRLDMRYLLSYKFHDFADDVDRAGMGRTLNFSIDGIVFEAFHALHPGQEVALTLALDENALAELRGQVLHARQIEKDRYRVGIKFTIIDPSVQRILKYLIFTQNSGK